MKSLMNVHQIYVLEGRRGAGPGFVSPLSLFDPDSIGPRTEKIRHSVPAPELSFSPEAQQNLTNRPNTGQ
jgi:serine protein kinase